jgi:hypothetical protein
VAPALAENGLLGIPILDSPLRAAVSRFWSARIGMNIGASKPKAGGPIRRIAARACTQMPISVPSADIDDGYIHGAKRMLTG